MATTINNIKVDFGLGATPPTVTFLQGCNMSVEFIRLTLRQIEQSEEGVMFAGSIMANGQAQGWICRAGGLFTISPQETTYIIVEIGRPFMMAFEAGAIAFSTSKGTLLGDFADSPGAVIQINNDLGGITLAGDIELNAEAAALYSKIGAQNTGHLTG